MEILVGNQIELALEYIKVHYPDDQYEVEIIIFEDEGFSGGTIDRPRFQAMLQLVKENSFNVLVCYRLDRISRNIADFSSLINELSKHNIDFISIKEQFDTRTPMGRAMMYIASVFAQLEREVIAERIKDNLLELAKTGTWLGGDAPLGFSTERFSILQNVEDGETDKCNKKRRTASKLIINEPELITLKLIYSKYMEFKALSKLETYLMNNDIKTRNGTYYSVFALKWILTNPAYAKNDKYTMEYFKEKGIKVFCEDDDRNKFDGKYGFLTYSKTSGGKNLPPMDWIYAVGLHPGIIPGEEWVYVQRLLEKNADKKYRAATGVKKQTIVSGLIRCKHCNSYMRPRNMDRKREDGTVNYGYCCILKEKSRGQKCNSKNVNGEKLDNEIINIIKNTFVPNSEIYKELQKMSIKKDNNFDNTELITLENEYNRKQEEIDNIIKKLSYIDVDLIDMVNSNLRKLKEEKSNLEEKISILKNNKSKENSLITVEAKTAKDIMKIIDESYKVFDKFDLKTKRDIAGLFIESIYGCDDFVEINLLNTKIDDSQKYVFMPSFVQESALFLDTNLPTEEMGKIAFKK